MGLQGLGTAKMVELELATGLGTAKMVELELATGLGMETGMVLGWVYLWVDW